jgi:uncharacterized peroxidase-related enzyme
MSGPHFRHSICLSPKTVSNRMQTPKSEKSSQPSDSQQTRAANLPLVDEANASAEVKHLYARFRLEFGRPQVPGILQCFATHPPLLDHMMGLAKDMLFIDGALGRRNKEMISAFVSAANRCNYCADSHGFSFRLQGGTASTLDAVFACDLDSEAIDLKDRALLQLVRKITNESQAITLGDVDAVRTAGWSDLEIAEAVHVTALFAAFNRVVNAFGLPSQQLLSQFELPSGAPNHGRRDG